MTQETPQIKLHCGDCLNVMWAMEPESVTAIVTDPPYDLTSGKKGDTPQRGFMNKAWDGTGVAFDPDTWIEALRVAKPGAMLLAFGGTRTHHRLTCAIEDAGWEIRDCVMWVYGSGFPKSLSVGKAIDKAAGAEREVVGAGPYDARRPRPTAETNTPGAEYGFGAGHNITAPATDAAKQWEGWYSCGLKPAFEPIVCAQKPLDGTYAANALKHGVAGIWVDGCRVGTDERVNAPCASIGLLDRSSMPSMAYANPTTSQGRWPANIIHDGSDEVLAGFPVTTSGSGDTGSAARFFKCCNFGEADRMFYSAKASKADRTMNGRVVNKHPTVKPLSLMRYLVRLVTMPANTVILDPFMGSGSTGVACIREGVGFIGIEKDAESFATAEGRIGEAVADAKERLFV